MSEERPTSEDRRAGSETQCMHQLQEAGQRFLTSFFSLLRTAAIHDFNNRALDRPAQQSIEALAPFLKRSAGAISVIAVEGQLYVDDIRVRVSGQTYELLGELEAFLSGRGIGGVRFGAVPAVDALKRFAYAIQQLPNGDSDPIAALQATLVGAGISEIQPLKPVRHRLEQEIAPSDDASGRVETTIVYAKAVSALSQLLADPSGRSQLRERQLRRVVQEIADCAGETLDYLVGLTERTAETGDRARMRVDVCVVAVSVARTMRLPRKLIADLGMAAMIASEQDLAGEGAAPDPRLALRELLEQPLWSPAIIRRALVLAQRDQPVQGSGGLPDQHPLARIYRVARDYVALTHGVRLHRSMSGQPMTPMDALDQLSRAPKRIYDRLVIAHLVRVVGLYPVGMLVQLNDGRQAYVTAQDENGHPELLIREGPLRFGARLRLDATGCVVSAVLPCPSPEERAVAVLGQQAQHQVRTLGDQVADGSQKMARVSVHRVAVRRSSVSQP